MLVTRNISLQSITEENHKKVDEEALEKRKIQRSNRTLTPHVVSELQILPPAIQISPKSIKL